MTLEEVQRAAQSLVQQEQLASSEVERLKEQLAAEKKSVSITSLELEELKKELERSKNEAEQLRSVEQSLGDRRYIRSKSRLELEDAKNTIAELREEIAYKNSVNRSLGLQLEKTIESNSELLLEIKDLDDLLQSREKEIEELKAEAKTSQVIQPSYEAEKAAWMQTVEKREIEIQELKGMVSKLEEAFMDKNNRADCDMLKREMENMESELAEISKENMNLMSQLMGIRHQTEEKDAMVKQLELKLQDGEGLEKKTKELENIVNNLREKLFLSEELAQSQLNSNKLSLEELNATMEKLCARNEQLEALQKSSEERMACLIEELDAQRKENAEHEKERSLLMSQRGQLKTLREKMATLTESYEAAKERVEGLELANKALLDENFKAMTSLKQQLKDSQDKLHEVYTECADMKEKVKVAESRASEISSHVTAKEIAEASFNSLQAKHVELQEKFASLLHEKEGADASMHCLQEARTQLQEELRNMEQSNVHTIEQLEARDLEVIQLNESLEVIKDQLQEVFAKLLESETAASAMEEELRSIKIGRENKSPHVKDLQRQISSMEEKLNASKESLSASDHRIQTLQYHNDELAEMLRTSMSLQEEVACRLESIKIKELELEQQLHEKVQALHVLEGDRAAWDQAMAELRGEVNMAEDGAPAFSDSREEEEGEGEGEWPCKSLKWQLGGLKASIRAMKMEKERAETSLQQLQSDTIKRVKEVGVCKEKVETGVRAENRVGNEGINMVKAKNCTNNSDPKVEVTKLRKLVADLRRKLLEQVDEKEDIRRKLAVLQKEVQRKSDLLLVAEKKLKERDRERVSQRTPTKYPPPNTGRKLGTADSCASQGSKVMADMMERIKALEGELHVKAVELEAAQFVLKEREAERSRKLERNTTDSVDDCADIPNYEENQRGRDEDINNGAVNTSKSLPLQCEGSTELKGGELREMKERYSEMSLRFVELQAEREVLLTTIKSLRQESTK